MRLSLVRSTSAFNCRALWWRSSGAFQWPSVPRRSGALLLLLLAAASTTAALLLLPAVTLHRLHRAVTKLDDTLPHGLQHRCESRSSTPACYRRTGRAARPQGADCRIADSHARSSCPLASASASRWSCTLLARPPTADQLFGRARGAERLAAAQRRPKKNLGPMGHRENQIRHGGRHQSVLRGKPFL